MKKSECINVVGSSNIKVYKGVIILPLFKLICVQQMPIILFFVHANPGQAKMVVSAKLTISIICCKLFAHCENWLNAEFYGEANQT